MVERRFLGAGQHESHAGAVEKRHRGHPKQQFHSQRLLIKRHGSVKLVNVDGDLSDLRQADGGSWSGHKGLWSGTIRDSGESGTAAEGWIRTRCGQKEHSVTIGNPRRRFAACSTLRVVIVVTAVSSLIPHWPISVHHTRPAGHYAREAIC